jgi:hypothetical protein
MHRAFFPLLSLLLASATGLTGQAFSYDCRLPPSAKIEILGLSGSVVVGASADDRFHIRTNYTDTRRALVGLGYFPHPSWTSPPYTIAEGDEVLSVRLADEGGRGGGLGIILGELKLSTFLEIPRRAKIELRGHRVEMAILDLPEVALVDSEDGLVRIQVDREKLKLATLYAERAWILEEGKTIGHVTTLTGKGDSILSVYMRRGRIDIGKP